MRKPTEYEQEAFDKIRVRKAHKAMFHVTKTILEKSIQDANRDICRVLLETGLVHYHQLELGEKQFLTGFFKGKKNNPIAISCYRTKGRGDKRIWFKGIGGIAGPDDMMALAVKIEGGCCNITIHNLTDISSEAFEKAVYQEYRGQQTGRRKNDDN